MVIHESVLMLHVTVAALARAKESYSDDDTFKESLQVQLRAAVENLELKKTDAITGIFLFSISRVGNFFFISYI